MNTATLDAHLARGAKVLAVLKKHGADIQDMADDLPKAIELGADLHAALKDDVPPSAPVVEPATPKLLEDMPPKITAKQAAAHVEKHGLTHEQRMKVDRETQLFG